MSRLSNRIARIALSVLVAAFVLPAFTPSSAAAQNIDSLTTICFKAASTELTRQAQAAGKSAEINAQQLRLTCAEFVTPSGQGSDTLCPTKIAPYVKQLGLPRDPATSQVCMAIYEALMG